MHFSCVFKLSESSDLSIFKLSERSDLGLFKLNTSDAVTTPIRTICLACGSWHFPLLVVCGVVVGVACVVAFGVVLQAKAPMLDLQYRTHNKSSKGYLLA
jgi:hypothetical protein